MSAGVPLAAVAAFGPGAALGQTSNPKSFVLAHGSWHGGWCWRRVADRLRGLGHTVFTPSYTGMGDRAHLLNRDITIDTFVQDLIAVIETEDLAEVILVGHSFGGIPISGVADRIPEKIARLVYLDAIVVENGKSAFSIYPPEDVKARDCGGAGRQWRTCRPHAKEFAARMGVEARDRRLRLGSTAPDAASARRLYDGPEASKSRRQWIAAHLRAPHASAQSCDRQLQRPGALVAGLELDRTCGAA